MLCKYLPLGEVLKPQGVRGQVKVRPDTDEASRFSGLEQVFCLIDNQYIPWSVENVSVRDEFVFCTLNHAATRDDAEKQRGAQLYIDREHAVNLEKGQYFISDLIGCRVEYEDGELLGTLTDVQQPGANDVYEIKTSNGKLVYLPAVAFILKKVAPEENLIVLDKEKTAEVAVFED